MDSIETASAERSEFSRAVELIEQDADSAVIHILFEEADDGVRHNLYTNITYGPAMDLASIPEQLDAFTFAFSSLTLIRQRVPIARAKTFAGDAAAGKAQIDVYDIVYLIAETIEGFRPFESWGQIGASRLNTCSSWRREHIGSRKEFAGDLLSEDSVLEIVARLSPLQQGRWLGIPLLNNPEKLGDFDEVWPSPIILHYSKSRSSASIEVTLEVDRLRLQAHRLTLTGTRYKNGLINGNVFESGAFPKLLADADCVDIRLLYDGLIMDQRSGCCVKTIKLTLAIGSPTILQVPKHKNRPKLDVPVGASQVSTTIIGEPESDSIRMTAWEIGRRFREDRIADDAERFFDPTDPSTTQAATAQEALQSLGTLGIMQRGETLTIVDPFVLDAPALFAIIAAAFPNRSPKRIAIYTEFKRHEGQKRSWFDALRRSLRRQLFPRNSATPSQRDLSEQNFFNVAQQVFKVTHVPIEVFSAEKLHDRFILLGDRVWHVGPSFNALGQEVAAIVEMRDRRSKARLRQYLDRLSANSVWKTT